MEQSHVVKRAIFTCLIVLITPFAQASLLEISVEATGKSDFIQHEDYINNLVDIERDTLTPIPVVDFSVAFDIDFSTPRSSRSVVFEIGDRRHSIFSSSFGAKLLGNTPFTHTLQGMLPSREFSPLISYTTDTELSYQSYVVSDVVSGKILQKESYDGFSLSDGFGFQNTADSNGYSYNVAFGLPMLSIFRVPDPIQHSPEALQRILMKSSSNTFFYSETVSTFENRINGRTTRTTGFSGKGTAALSVSAPRTLMIMLISTLFIMWIKKQQKNHLFYEK